MAKNRKPPQKPHIRQKGFEDRNISPLEHHKRQGPNLLAPLNADLNLNLALSWQDTALNEMLWAVLLRGNLDQGTCLSLFRHVIGNAHENLADRRETYITHSALSALPDDTFDIWVAPLLENEKARDLLRSLLFFDSLPDRAHWARHLEPPDPAIHSEPLMRAVEVCLDHQSQESTDIRWLKIAYFMFVCERMKIALPNIKDSQERVTEIRLYPDHGDQQAVRPRIRANEIWLRGSADGRDAPFEVPITLRDKIPAPWHDQFWKECLTAAPCILPQSNPPGEIDASGYIDQLVEIMHAVCEHFLSTLENTNINAKHDAAFGLLMYAITLSIGLGRGHSHQRVEGRIIIRTLVENYITFKFLAHHDNQTIWMQFRNYGVSQSKLAFLKNLREESIPSFISLEDLERYASEDIWQEFININLKSWAEKNLRAMADEAGVKGFYDKYYDWSSGFVHGHWGAVRDTNFIVCLNPLHRHHRVLFIPRLDMPSVLPDAVKIVNLMLDLLSQLYPPFKRRIKHSVPAAKAEAPKAPDDAPTGGEAPSSES